MSSKAPEREIPEIEFVAAGVRLDYPRGSLAAALRQYKWDHNWVLRYFTDERWHSVVIPDRSSINGKFIVVSSMTNGHRTHMLLQVDLSPSDLGAPEYYGRQGSRAFTLASINDGATSYTSAAVITTYDRTQIDRKNSDWTLQYLTEKEHMIAWRELLSI